MHMMRIAMAIHGVRFHAAEIEFSVSIASAIVVA
jgi:hypothetical protein